MGARPPRPSLTSIFKENLDLGPPALNEFRLRRAGARPLRGDGRAPTDREIKTTPPRGRGTPHSHTAQCRRRTSAARYAAVRLDLA
eukprot:6328550-Prymnesium_polylepis.1